jgi:hypothetical protein
MGADACFLFHAKPQSRKGLTLFYKISFIATKGWGGI